MVRDRLGLFDTPPDRQEIRSSLAVVGLLFGVLCLAFPLCDIRLGEISIFVPLVDSFMLFSELIIATLLYAQASVLRSRAMTVLASAYVFAALILIPHALTFPGAFTTDRLLGAGTNTTAWLAIFRRFTFPIAVISYALLKSMDSVAQNGREWTARVMPGVFAATGLAVLVTLLATSGHDWLPSIFRNDRDTVPSSLIIVNLVTIGLTIAAITLLFRQNRSVLDVWLLVALSGWIFQSLLNITLQTRYTLGWYGLNVMSLAASIIVMLALIGQANRLYVRLALSTAARKREREARLMSMDAVTASISHEVGQPLTAVALNTSAAVRWLTRAKPDVKNALKALREASDARQRTVDIIRSIRATFAKEPGRATEFSLNDLVRDTAALLHLELTASKVSLKLSLDETLPPISADRVQMQRVLVNLLINAIESLRDIADRPRHVAIRSALVDGKDVLLQVSDTGTGIEPGQSEHIFDAFFTTKATGTGLGLPLCRSIVEDHGGVLSASRGEPHGATFHLRLPRSGAFTVSLEGTGELLSNLETSLRLLRQSESEGLADAIAELEHVVDEVRVSLTPTKL